uniref:Uncharacterized protein n=1 Tax=Anguilla anguilla TaxID=7936 RepID=A0A0E9X583_ANGAN
MIVSSAQHTLKARCTLHRQQQGVVALSYPLGSNSAFSRGENMFTCQLFYFNFKKKKKITCYFLYKFHFFNNLNVALS